MKKQKKIFMPMIVFATILLSSCNVFAFDWSSGLVEIPISENYLKYMELSDEEKQNAIMPRMYDIPKTITYTKNPLNLARMAISTSSTRFSLADEDVIPENMVIKNQQDTGSCWTFSSLAALESSLAMKDYRNGNSTVVYDFSERHMEYATSKTFSDGTNENGFNREVGTGGGYYLSIPYLTNGTGPISESEMEFVNNEEKISLSNLENKTVIAQVNDTVSFPSYSFTDDKTDIIQQMKEHISNYGAIDVGIHVQEVDDDVSCFNYMTGAFYNSSTDTKGYGINHAVAIVGWDDDYSVENFAEGNRPENNGAWIIKNSWGEESERYTLSEMKEYIYNNFTDYCTSNGWNSVTDIPDDRAIDIFESSGYTIDENNEAIYYWGDKGFMYVSYEDASIYINLTGIEDAQTEIEYENIYQYDEYGAMFTFGYNTSKLYLATVFDKQTTTKEYLTQVAITSPDTYTYKVYVNPNGTSKSMDDLQLVQLKAGETETLEAGYHTIEFADPLQITGNEFVVVLEVQGTGDVVMATGEFNSKDYAAINQEYAQYSYSPLWDDVSVGNGEGGVCFFSTEEAIAENEWVDTYTFDEWSSGVFPSIDTTIKAFTTSEVLESIEITTPPTKTSYLEKENFDATGMVVKAKYGNGTLEEITDYTITNGTNLTVGQTSVTISYKGKTATQSIEVLQNSVESITIKIAPDKTEYYAGEDFDATGMVVEATYTDGTTETITDYTIVDGSNLKNGQTTVTISYEGLTVTQAIIVNDNSVVSIAIKQAPNKVKYVVGQDFDSTGMIVEVTYENGMVKQVEDYTVQDGTDLQEGQTTVTISYEGLTVTQEITVEVKSVTSISVITKPSKTEYIQNKEELDLTGGIIEILYNDNTTENMLMTSQKISASGFNNEELGTQTITLTYKGKTTQFTIEIKEEAKPENSNFDNMKGNVKRVRTYSFTDTSKKEYTILNVELTDIVKATENDKMEYYYYLSSNQKETDIKDWVKINDLQESGNQLSFEINTSDITNYDDVSNAENLYLYIKEVATRNDSTKEAITSSVLLEVEDINIEEYLDGEKKADVNPGTSTDSTPGDKEDSTVAPGTIPNAGKSILIVGLVLAVLIIGRMAYLKYKDIEI